MEKRSHLGMAGHYAAMAEFLYRGYNVAVPSVDVGDDVYVVEDCDGSMWRLQIKTSDDVLTSKVSTYTLSRRQLRTPKRNELFFMFMRRWERRWRFLLIGREELLALRTVFEASDRSHVRGPRPKPDGHAKTDALALRIEWSAKDATGWGASFAAYLDAWPSTFPENPAGPGSIG